MTTTHVDAARLLGGKSIDFIVQVYVYKVCARRTDNARCYLLRRSGQLQQVRVHVLWRCARSPVYDSRCSFAERFQRLLEKSIGGAGWLNHMGAKERTWTNANERESNAIHDYRCSRLLTGEARWKGKSSFYRFRRYSVLGTSLYCYTEWF